MITLDMAAWLYTCCHTQDRRSGRTFLIDPDRNCEFNMRVGADFHASLRYSASSLPFSAISAVNYGVPRFFQRRIVCITQAALINDCVAVSGIGICERSKAYLIRARLYVTYGEAV